MLVIDLERWNEDRALRLDIGLFWFASFTPVEHTDMHGIMIASLRNFSITIIAKSKAKPATFCFI